MLGSAGTGKTILLREAIERIDTQQTILLVCFNALLSRYFKDLFKAKINVTAIHYNAIKRLLSKPETSQDVSHNKNKDHHTIEPENRLETYSSELERTLVSLDERNQLQRFDWILIDEGQDFLMKIHSPTSAFCQKTSGKKQI